MKDDTRTAAESPYRDLVRLLGFALIAAGIALAYFVLREAWSLYQNLDGNVFVDGVLARLPDQILFSIDGRPFVLSAAGTLIVAVVLFILLASFAVRVALALINAGVQVLSPSFARQLTGLKEELARLRERGPR